MKFSRLRPCRHAFLPAALIFSACLAPAFAQQKPAPSNVIDLDKALEAKVPRDLASSYYYYALAKWMEEKGDLEKAVSNMRNALKYNDTSAAVRTALAGILFKSGNPNEAIEQAQEGARLDPTDPQPRWLLANIYLRAQSRGRTASKDSLKKGIAELEALRKISPSDERVHYTLGGAYFELGEPDKAIEAYERFQALAPSVDAGYIEIAKYYDRTGNTDRAIEYLEKAVKSRPDSTESLIYLASMYAKQNKDNEAIPLFRKLIEITGDNPAVKKQLALSLVNHREFEEAKTVLEQLAQAAPNDREVQILLGRTHLGLRQFPEAIRVLKSVLEASPDLLEAQFYLGTAHEAFGNPAEAANIFSLLLEQTKGASEEHKANRLVFQQRLASVYLDMGENEKAIALYEDMVKSEPAPNPDLAFLLINALRTDRQYDKALSLGKQQFDRHPGNTSIGLVYARTLADAGKFKEGAAILTNMLKEDPDNIDIYVNLSQVYLQAKRYSDAVRVLRQAEDKRLDSERVKFQLATVYERQKDFDRAETLFKEILKKNPNNAVALNYIGYMLADRGVRLNEAVEYVKAALAIDPNNGAYLDSLGWAFFKLNDLEQAEKYLLQAVGLVKNDPVIHDHLGDLYYKTGDFEKAEDFWNKSLGAGGEEEEARKVREKLIKLQETVRRQKRQR